MNKLKIALVAVAGVIGSFLGLGVASAATTTPITIPATLGSDFLAFAGGQLADPGTLLLLLIALGVPFAFYLIGRIRKVVPKS
jgi:hypothetical protein